MKTHNRLRSAVVVTTAILLGIFSFTPLVELKNAYAEDTDERGHDDHDGHNELNERSGNDEKQGDGDTHDGENLIKMTAAQIKEFGIVLDVAGSGQLHSYIKLPGEIVLNLDRVAHIGALIPGQVHRVFKTTGDTVKKGEVIATLASKEMGEAKTEYFTSKAMVAVGIVEKSVAVTQVDVTKTDMNIVVAKQKIAATNLEWQKIIHANTKLLLNLLQDKTSLDTIIEQLLAKPIGDSRTKLLNAYVAQNYAKASFEREAGLWQKKISSESDYLSARQNFSSTKSEFQAASEAVAFENRLALMEKEQAYELATQDVLSAQQAIKVAEQDVMAKDASLNVALSSLKSAIRKLQLYGHTETEIASFDDQNKKSKNIARYKIRAPFSGTIIERHITLGEMVNEESATFVLADLSSVWANLNVYQKDLASVHKGQSVTITTGHGLSVRGNVAWVSPLVGEETRTAVARVVLSNKKGHLLPGLFVNGKLASANNNTVSLMIPKTAIQKIDGQTLIFVKKDGGFEPQPVTIGRDNGTEIEILSGLHAGQAYVKAGVFTLKAELAKGSFGDGHNH